MNCVAKIIPPNYHDSVPTSGSSEIWDKHFHAIQNHFMQSEYFGATLKKIKHTLDELQEEYSKPNWDGYDASPLNRDSAKIALDFAALLPRAFAQSDIFDILVENDGEIAFEWDGGPRKIFSISFSTKSLLQYSGLFGHERMSGRLFFYDKVPSIIHAGIKRAL